MDLLARREHSRLELTRKLRRRYAPEEVEAALEALADEGLQSETRFATAFARERMLRGYGPLRIVSELGERGVNEALAVVALREVCEEEGVDWRLQAQAVLLKKFGIDALPADYTERVRCLRFLSYRGFPATEWEWD
jgi:regulatory protein